MDCYHSLLQAGSQLENTLQLSVSMSMKEVDGYIEKQVAYLSGGRGEDSSVIVTLPEYSAFSDIPEESLAKVLTYLTLIPRARQPGVKFIIILDRRLDTWTSIKTALARIAASFPGNLHLVLVLRPTSFFQRTVTDLGFRFSQEDFMLKMPVVMLSSVTDLLRYVDENQLTSEFGGTLDYCHSDWIVLRTAIESFAVTVKDIAQMLQAFGTELAETKLPAEGTAIMRLLSTHTDKYRKLKEAIRSVSKEGRHLLASLEASGREEDSLWDVRLDWETVQRLLAQLRGMESAFDGFFEKHHLKLQQYLQLLRYEHRFQEMELSLEHLASQEREMSSSGEKLTQTEQTLRDLDILEAHAQEEMVSAQIIILHGHQLAASHHYAMALILQRSNELRHRCDMLNNALRVKRTHLSQAHRLLLRLGQAQSWCDDGAYLLAQQLVDKFHSKDGAQAALKDMDRFLERAPSLLSSGPDLLAVEFESVLTPEIQVQIGETFEKHTVVQEMIHNRQVCLRKLADKHVPPIQLVAPRAESPPRSKSPLFSPKHGVDGLKFSFDLSLPGKRTSRKSPASRKIEVMHDYQENRSSLLSSLEGEDSPDLLKRHVMRELIETERVYVEELLSVLLGYRGEMENPALAGLLPPILHSKRNVLFGNMPEIYNFHSRVFLHDLEGCLETPEGVGACFLERKENFKVYECYCQNKPRSESLWRQYSDCAFFQECQKKLEHKLGLDSYLLKPVQRLTKYQLLLKELLKYSAGGCEGTSELQAALAAMLHLLKSVNDSMHQIAITGYQGELCDLGRVLMQGSFSVWISHKKGPTRMKELARFKPTQRHLFLYERALLFCKCREEHGEGADKTPSYSFKHCLKMSAVGITENVKGDVKKFEIWYSGREEVYAVQAPTVEVKTAWLGELRRILTNQQKLLKDEHCVDIQMPDHIRRSPPMSESKQQRASFSSEDTVREEQSRPTVPLPKSPAQPTQRARHASHNGHLSGSGGVGWRSGPLSPVRHRGGGHCSAGSRQI
uniref:proto-oncogene DBL-like isoform X2 n=1 Tax=Oncorhynchus gorbuscha TaxID=8017 RepID=UPI001EAEE1D4|nr:proto-oncogene DBL-like isoform X2 [Oncorhynchus gorbuscha]